MGAFMLIPHLLPVMYRALAVALLGWPESRPADEDRGAE